MQRHSVATQLDNLRTCKSAIYTILRQETGPQQVALLLIDLIVGLKWGERKAVINFGGFCKEKIKPVQFIRNIRTDYFNQMLQIFI